MRLYTSILRQMAQRIDELVSAEGLPAPPYPAAPAVAAVAAVVAAAVAAAPAAPAAPAPATRRCGYCRNVGHRQTYCPLKEEHRLANLVQIGGGGGGGGGGAAPAAPQRRITFTPSVQTDCPVCFDNKLCCVLACNHHLCFQCVRAQFASSLMNCGLCRAPLAPK